MSAPWPVAPLGPSGFVIPQSFLRTSDVVCLKHLQKVDQKRWNTGWNEVRSWLTSPNHLLGPHEEEISKDNDALKCMTSRSQVYHTSLHATGSPAYLSICIPHYCIIWKYQSFIYLVFQLCIVLLKLWQNLWEALIKRNRTYMYTHCKLSLKFGIIII